jgi:hypothetical protein
MNTILHWNIFEVFHHMGVDTLTQKLLYVESDILGLKRQGIVRENSHVLLHSKVILQK